MTTTMTDVVVLRPGARVWRADGEAATVTEIGQLGVYAKVDGERLPVILGLLAWRLALACEYCDRPAEVQMRDGQPTDVLCKGCAGDHYERPADWVRPIPRTVIRALYDGCQRLA
jgi:hypothetical protein